MWKHIYGAMFQSFALGWSTLAMFSSEYGWLMLGVSALNAYFIVDYVEKAHRAWQEEKR
jgi:hypothetical protein